MVKEKPSDWAVTVRTTDVEGHLEELESPVVYVQPLPSETPQGNEKLLSLPRQELLPPGMPRSSSLDSYKAGHRSQHGMGRETPKAGIPVKASNTQHAIQSCEACSQLWPLCMDDRIHVKVNLPGKGLPNT